MSAGLSDHLTLDGETLILPKLFESRNTLAQTLTQAAARPRLDAMYFGDGMPNVMDRFEWVTDYNLDDDQQTTLDRLEQLRTEGGVHVLADWRLTRYTYTAGSGQQFYYLPRRDAFSLGYSGHTTQADWGAVVTLNGSALTVLYKTTVVTGDVVPSGECWIGNTAVTHTASGLTVAPFKIGTAISLNDIVRVAFFPLYRCVVTDVPTAAIEQVGIEGRALYLAEVA